MIEIFGGTMSPLLMMFLCILIGFVLNKLKLLLNAFGPVGYGKAGSFEGFCSGGGIAQLGKMYAREN